QARLHLDIALEDCLSAKDLSQQARIVAEGRAAKPEQYTVQRGDTLWGISAQEAIYRNSLMWPIIYKANRDQIHDPDLIFPKQIFVIPRTYSQEEADAAIQRARKRRSWRLGDGPDMYILEGIQQ
ncbi:MAG: LysM peptidoglycan-binding domain-containing protein, partial [Candidatus Tectomicrobia bacterium]